VEGISFSSHGETYTVGLSLENYVFQEVGGRGAKRVGCRGRHDSCLRAQESGELTLVNESVLLSYLNEHILEKYKLQATRARAPKRPVASASGTKFLVPSLVVAAGAAVLVALVWAKKRGRQ
jgi:hypothetical protein